MDGCTKPNYINNHENTSRILTYSTSYESSSQVKIQEIYF